MPKFLNRYYVLGINSSGTSRKEPDLHMREHDVDYVRPYARFGQERASYEKLVYPVHRSQQLVRTYLNKTDSQYSRNNG